MLDGMLCYVMFSRQQEKQFFCGQQILTEDFMFSKPTVS